MIGVAVVALGYLAAVRHRSRPWSRWRTASALLGLLLVAAALVGPASHDDLPAHMVAHLLLGMYAPLALVLGAPATLLLSVSPVRARRPVAALLHSRAVRVLTSPWTAALLSVGGLYVLYLTPLYAVSMHSPRVRDLLHLHFLLSGYLLAWALAGPDPAPRRPGIGVRVAVLVAAGGAHAFLAQLLYSRAPRWPVRGMQTAAQVRLAAQEMYWGGHLDELLLLIVLFADWYRRRAPRPARENSAQQGGESLDRRREPSVHTAAGTGDEVLDLQVDQDARVVSRTARVGTQPDHHLAPGRRAADLGGGARVDIGAVEHGQDARRGPDQLDVRRADEVVGPAQCPGVRPGGQ